MDAIQRMNELDAVARLQGRDATLFGEAAEVAELVSQNLGWLDVARSARYMPDPRLAKLEQLAFELTDVVVLGTGAESLAARALGVAFADEVTSRMHVIDSPAPRAIARALEELDPASTIYVVSSKTGRGLALDLYATFRAAADARIGRDEAGQRFVAITDPGTELTSLARAEGFRVVFHGNPRAGEHYSALTVFGLVPAALLGVDTGHLIGRATHMEEGALFEAEQSPVAGLAASIVEWHADGRDKLTIVTPPKLRPFARWAEDLMSAALPPASGVTTVVDYSPSTPEGFPDDRAIVLVRFKDDLALGSWGITYGETTPVGDIVLRDYFDIAGEFVRWEYAAALAGALLGVNPFAHEDPVPAAAAIARALDAPAPPASADLAAGLPALGERGYLAIRAFLPDDAPESLAPLEAAIAAASLTTGRAVTLAVNAVRPADAEAEDAVFVVVTTDDAADVAIPGKPHGFRALLRARGDAEAALLADAGRQVVRVVLPDASQASIEAFAADFERATGVA